MSVKRTIAALAAAGCLLTWPAFAVASPGRSIFGSLTVGPGGLNNFNWQINDAGPSSQYPNAPGVAGPSPDANNQVSGWSLVSAAKVRPSDTGNLTWTATSTPGQQFNFALQTLVGPRTTVGNDIPGPMADFNQEADADDYLWPVITWTGTYTGPMTDFALNSTILVDKTNFLNFAPAFGVVFHLDLANKEITIGVPEPGTFALTGLGLLAAWRYRQRFGRAATLEPHLVQKGKP